MIIPVIIGAIALGRSFDFNNAAVKDYYIFDPDDVKSNLEFIPRTFTSSRYRLVESSSDANDLLDVDGDLSLKVKNGDIGLQGYGKYLTNTVNRDKSVEMLITVLHETGTETFPSYTKLRTDWQKRPQADVGSHYIRSATYGGQLMISYKLTATRDEYTEEIKAAVTANLAISGSLDAEVKGKLEMLNKQVGDKSRVEITAYATAAGPISPPQSIEDCLKLVDEYPQKVKDTTGGKGSLLKIELVDLSTLQSDYSEYLRNYALDGMLNEATNKYDDLRLALKDFKDWEKAGGIWPPDDQKKIDEYQTRLKKANRAMSDAISILDSSKGVDQFDEAFKAYGWGETNIPNKYSRELQRLIYEVEKRPVLWFPYTKAISHYVHWGSINCSLPSTEPLFIGYAATSPSGFGNGGNLECLKAKQPSLWNKTLSKDTVVSQMNGIMYKLPDGSAGQTFCASCKLENATVAYTISGRTSCPEDMKLEYTGYLMASRDSGSGSAFVCLDDEPDQAIPNYSAKSDKNAAVLTPVWMQCPDCDEDENKKYVSCVVCSR